MNMHRTVAQSNEEAFTEENGYMVSNLLYEGISTANGGVNIGYKVISKDGRFQGLLDQSKLAVWNTREDSVKLI